MEKHRPEDNLFKKILENHPDFTPSRSDMKDMNNRLDGANETNRKNGFGRWWIPLLFLPLFFATSFLIYKNQKLDTQVQLLQSKLLTIQKDTTQHNFITYHYDTIYKTIHIDEYIERQSKQNYSYQSIPVLNYLSDNSRDFLLRSPTIFSNTKNDITLSNPFIYGSSNTFTTLQNYNIHENLNQSNTNKYKTGDNLKSTSNASNDVSPIASQFNFLKDKENVNLLLQGVDPMYEYKKRRRNPLHYFSPKGFRIGLEGSPYSLTKIREGKFSPTTSYGIAGEIEFNENVRLLLCIRKVNLNFEEKDPIYTSLYPSVMSNDPTDLLRELYISVNQLQVPISLKYLFAKDKNWRPFVSFGLVASRPIQQRFKYKYISTSLEQYQLNQNFRNGVFSINNIQGALGFETNLTPKISTSASLYYLHDFELNIGEYFFHRNAGLNLSLKYKL